MGPRRSGAGVGIGMLRPFLEQFGFRDLSRFHDCKIPFLPKKVGEADRIGDTTIQKIFIESSKGFQQCLRFDRVLLMFHTSGLSIRSLFLFFDFEISDFLRNHRFVLFLPKRVGDADRIGDTNNSNSFIPTSLFSNIFLI